MADYNLTNLGTRSFEQLIQSLAVRIVGPHVEVFGDGPDGGREATFHGLQSYPSVEKPWDGYGVIQAKFRQRPERSLDDTAWLLGEVKKEIDAYTAPRSVRRRPEYYILATNVVLTPAQNNGSLDKVTSKFEEYALQLGLHGYAIWHYDKIRTFLDNNEDVRRAYAAWITPGDVLSEALRALGAETSDAESVISSYIQRELLADQYANLEQAGHTADERIPLAPVFVDLPVSGRSVSFRRNALPRDDSEMPRFVQHLVRLSQERFTAQSHQSEAREGQHALNRVVLLGGPGQGKTTLAQFICQLFRTALLRERPQHTLISETQDIIKAIDKQCISDKIPQPPCRRFPVRIPLNQFARALASNEDHQVTSVFSYIRHHIVKRTDRGVSDSTLRRWLRDYPWIVVFDGLDEVPASSNRDEVITAIREFTVEAAECDSDLLIVVTTRPQGYNDDFASPSYQHWSLAPLTPDRATAYANRLTEVRFGNDSGRAEKVMDRLIRALHHEATARLMTTPLQVTIMATLVDRRGTPPRERWRLFKEYYEVIYLREQERQIPAAAILNQYRADIDAIHADTAFMLQVASEHTGTTDARLSHTDFEKVVDARLRQEDHDERQRSELKRQILDAATNRLVFLVGLEEGRIGFEIRSLQEFMAAEGMMDGSDKHVELRLRRLAPVSHWRNVFLFAAGRCFADRQHLRSHIVDICGQLNCDVDDPLTRLSLEGSWVALDLLEDGAVLFQPLYARQFVQLALKLLDLPVEDCHRRLASVYHDSFEVLYRDELVSRLASQSTSHNIGTWRCLLHLVQQGVPWAIALADKYWPETPSNLTLVIAASQAIRDEAWVGQRLPTDLPLVDPRRVSGKRFPGKLRWDVDGVGKWYDAALDVLGLSSKEKMERIPTFSRLVLDGTDVKELSWTPISGPSTQRLVALASIPHPSEHWLPYVANGRFLEEPSPESLARETVAITEYLERMPLGAQRYSSLVHAHIVWPLEACVREAMRNHNHTDLARAIRQGSLGGLEEWIAAERRWREFGIRPSDISYMTNDEHWPFDAKIAEMGFPFDGASRFMLSSSGRRGHEQRALAKLQSVMPPGRMRQVISSWRLELAASSLLNGDGPSGELSIEELQEIVRDIRALASDAFFPLNVLEQRAWDWSPANKKLVELLDEVGNLENVWSFPYPIGLHRLSFEIDVLQKIADVYLEREGITRVLALFVKDRPTVKLRGLSRVVMASMTSQRQMIRESGILLGLVGEGQSVALEQVLTECAAAVQVRPDFLYDVVNVLTQRVTLGVHVLPHLYERVGLYDCERRGRIALACREVLTHQLSSLSDRDEWTQLGLTRCVASGVDINSTSVLPLRIGEGSTIVKSSHRADRKYNG